MERLISTLFASTVISAALIGGAAAADKAKVFFLLPNETTIRFESRDAPFFVAAMKEKAPDVEVVVANAQGDPSKQRCQVEGDIAQGAKVLLLTSSDANL